MANIVETIHTQLECLKYVPRPAEEVSPGRSDGAALSQPSDKSVGEGIDISLLLLPCLVFDFREGHLTKEGKTCVVGGRAARIACTLLHLQDEDDATYRVHLLTKTGTLGRLLLQNEFYLPELKRHARHLNLELVGVREGQPRSALISHAEGQAKIQAKDLQPDEEVSPADLNTMQAKRALAEAGTVCLASITTPHFAALFRQICATLNPEKQSLFVDATRPKNGSVPMLVRELAARAESSTRAAGVPVHLFLPTENGTRDDVLRAASEFFQEELTLPELARRLRVEIIEYGTGFGVRHTPVQGGETICFPSNIDFAVEDVPERLKAGVLLAYSLAEAVRQLKIEGEARKIVALVELHTRLGQFWRPNRWTAILGYATALASTKPNQDSYCDLPALIRGQQGAESDHVPAESKLELVKDVSQPARSGLWREFNLEDTRFRGLARLAGFRRLLKGQHPELAICTNPPAECSPCPTKEDALQGQATAAVLIDIDSALMNSTRERFRALLPALLKLPGVASHAPGITEAETRSTAASPASPGESPVEFFERHIYELHELFQLMGKGDFRRVWNHPGWYAAYLVFQAKPCLADQVQAGWQALSKEERKMEEIKTKPWWQEFEPSYDDMLHRHADSIRAAQAEFRATPLSPLKEARDLLRSLQQTGACRLYIVSEGDPETRWLKLRSTGLDTFFTRAQVLTTGDAAQTCEARNALNAELNALERKRAEIAAERRWRDQRVKSLGALKEQLLAHLPGESDTIRARVTEVFDEERQEIPQDYYDKAKKAEQRLALQVQATKFAEMVLMRMEEKHVMSFYAAVIRAILRNPDYPREELRSFARLMGKNPSTRKLKFVMIGDRQKSDIAPVAELLGNEGVLTIRLMCGKYAAEEPPSDSARPYPKFISYTLAQAKAFLLSKPSWDSVKCAGDPPLFNWTVDLAQPLAWPQIENDKVVEPKIGLDYLLYGVRYADEGSATRTICAGVLAEYLLGHQADLAAVIRGCEKLALRKVWPDAAVVGRCLVLPGLVEAGILAPRLLPATKVVLQQQLLADKKQLAGWPPSDRLEALQAKVNRALDLCQGQRPACQHV